MSSSEPAWFKSFSYCCFLGPIALMFGSFVAAEIIAKPNNLILISAAIAFPWFLIGMAVTAWIGEKSKVDTQQNTPIENKSTEDDHKFFPERQPVTEFKYRPPPEPTWLVRLLHHRLVVVLWIMGATGLHMIPLFLLVAIGLPQKIAISIGMLWTLNCLVVPGIAIFFDRK